LPFLVLCDINMPHMSGHEFLKRVRASSSLRGLPVVIMSASTDEQDLRRSYRLEATSHLTKLMDFGAFTAQMIEGAHYWLCTNRFPENWAQTGWVAQKR
jgi:CheY-like chemotaxis protein